MTTRTGPGRPGLTGTLRWPGALAPLAVLLLSVGLGAQDAPSALDPGLPPEAISENAPYRLHYNHLTGGVRLVGPQGRVVEQWETRYLGKGGIVVPVPPDRPVVVIVDDANPLLYRYEVGVLPVARRGVRTCGEIGGEFAQQGVLVGLGAYGGQQAELPDVSRTMSGGSVLRLWEETEPQAIRGSAQQTLSEGALEQALTTIRAQVTSYAAMLEEVDWMASTLADSLQMVAELGDAYPADSLLAALQGSLERQQAGLSDPARLPRALRDRAQSTAAQLNTLAEMERAILTGRYGGDPFGAGALEVLSLSDRIQDAQAAVEAAYPALRSELLRLERARSLAHPSFTVASSRDFRRVNIVTTPREGFEDVLRTRSGTVAVFTEPTVSLLCQVSLGFTFMDPPPRYEVEDGVVTDATGEETRTSFALMLMLSTPRFPLLGLLGGIGIGTDQRPDLYLGGSLRFFDPVMLNAGVVWQREHELPDGIRLGSPIADSPRLEDLDRAYKPSLFFGISLLR